MQKLPGRKISFQFHQQLLAALLLLSCFVSNMPPAFSQNGISLSSPEDPLISAGAVTFFFGGNYLYNHKHPLTEGQILSLNPKSVNGFDRSATLHYSVQAGHTSDVLL